MVHTSGRRLPRRMKPVLLAALALLVIAPALAPVAAAHHGGWDCKGTPGTAEVCTAKTLQTGYDCFLTTDVLGNEQAYCYM